MANPLEHVAWESCVLELHRDRALESWARKRQGIANPSLGYFAPVPWLARALVDRHPEYGLLMRSTTTDGSRDAGGEPGELVPLLLRRSAGMLWAQGMSRTRIQRIEQDLARADLPPRTLAAMAFGRSQSRSGPAGARAARGVLEQAGVDADEMREIAFAVALTDFSNRAHSIPAVPTRPLERMPDQLHIRLLRPLLNRLLRRSRYPGRPTPLEGMPSPPYARLVGAYAGSPIGAAMARTLEEMWASPHLTRRCKLLMLAVVARGLACEACAPELREALQREGVTEATLTQVLTHLDAPQLDPVERLLIPFARETIWYEPAPMQRRTRALRERLSGPQLIEAIGVASLANGLCRLGAMVLDPP